MKPKNKTNMKRYFITMLALFTLIFCSAGCGGCSKKDPKEALEAAYEKTFIDNNPLETIVGFSDINEAQNGKKAHSTGLSLTLQDLSGEGLDDLSAFSGLGFTMDSASDLANRKTSGSLSVNYGGSTYITLGGHMQGSKVFLTVPQLLDGSISLDLSTIKEDLESDSLLATALRENGLTLPEDFSTDIFESLGSLSALENLGNLTSAMDDFTESILVKEADKSVSAPDDVKAKSLYTVTIPADAYTDLAKSFMEFFFGSVTEYFTALAEAFDGTVTEADLTELNDALDEFADIVGDITLTVAVNGDGYITYVTSEVTSETGTFTLTAKFLGKENPLHNTQVEFSGDIDGETFAFTYEDSFDTDDNTIALDADLTIDKETVLKVAFEGELTDVEKGKKYTLDMDFLELEVPDVLSVSLAGSYYIDTTKCDITAPTGTEYGLLTMTESDLTALVMEVLTNLQEDPLLSELLNYIDLGF